MRIRSAYERAFSMTKASLIFASLLVFVSDNSATADDRTNEQVLAAKQFTFEGVALSCSLKDFLRTYPSAQLWADETQPNVGIKCYRVLALQSADMAEFRFLDDSLFQVVAVYMPDRLKRIGGHNVLLARLAEKFGLPDHDSPGRSEENGQESFTFKWKFAEAQRGFAYRNDPNCCVILFWDSSKSDLAEKRRAEKANFGF